MKGKIINIIRQVILPVLMFVFIGQTASLGQTTLASEDFENSISTFSVTTGTASYYSGSTHATDDAPVSSPFAVLNTYSLGKSNSTLGITSNSIVTTGFSTISLSLRLVSLSIGSTTNGAEVGDIVTVEVSPDGGTTYYSTVRVLGNTNAYWSYSAGTGNASTGYDGDVTPVDFSPAAGGSRTTDGYSTITITSLPAVASLIVRITLLNNSANERWCIDNFLLTGTYVSNTTDYFRSLGTGSWNTAGTWQSSPDNINWYTATLVPTSSAAAITVQSGHTITINADATAPSITIAGTGILTFDGVAARAVTVTGDIAITGTGSFITQAAGAFTNTLSIAGDITNASIFDMSRGGTTLVCDVTFNKNGNQAVSGAGATTRFNEITLNMGASNANVLEISSSNFAAPDGFVETTAPSLNRIQNGTLKLSGTFTYTGCPFIVNGQDNTIASTAGFWLNNSNVTISAIGDSYDITGLLRVSSGTLNIGTSSGQSLNFITGSSIIIEGGTINVAGRLCSSGNPGDYSTTFNQSSGTLVLCTAANASTTKANLDFTKTTNSFTMSGGTIIIRHETIVNGTDILFGAITSNITGGTIQLADASSSVSFPNGFRVSSSITLPDIVVYNILVSATYPWLKFSANATLGGILTAQSNTTVDVNTRTVTVAGTSTILGTLTTSTGTYDANGTFDATGGNVTFTGAGNLNLGSTVTSLGTFTESTSTVSYDATANQNIDPDTYYHLIIDGSGTKTLAGSIDVNGNLTITAGTLAVVSYTVNLAGNLSNAGTTSVTSGNVIFDGGTAQTISGAGTTTFHDLAIANTSGDVALSINATVTGTLTMTTGDLVIATTKKLSITDVDDPGISGGSATTMIVTSGNASVEKTYTSTTKITFPMGDGTKYRPIALTPSGIGSTVWTVGYTPDGFTDFDIQPATGLDHVSYHEYWSCVRTGGSPENAIVELTWISTSDVSDYTLLEIGHYDGTTDWDMIEANPVGDNTSGTLTSSVAVSTFSPFTIGTTSAINVLPIKLTSFTGKQAGKNNELKWTTVSEINNDYFTVEKTTDGNNFETIGTVKGAGNSNQFLNYSMIDYDVRNVLNYYRLKQTDFDGKYDFSNTITIDNRKDFKVKEISSVTNLLGQEVNEYFRGVVIVVYSDGTVVKVIQ